MVLRRDGVIGLRCLGDRVSDKAVENMSMAAIVVAGITSAAWLVVSGHTVFALIVLIVACSTKSES